MLLLPCAALFGALVAKPDRVARIAEICALPICMELLAVIRHVDLNQLKLVIVILGPGLLAGRSLTTSAQTSACDAQDEHED